MKQEVSAVIVARKGSVRVPCKNMLPLGNDTLISRKIKQLKESKNVINTVPTIRSKLVIYFASTIFSLESGKVIA